MDDTPYIPPSIKLLIEEDLGDLTKPEDFSRRYRRLAKELAQQAEWSYEHFDYFDERSKSPGPLVVTASSGLNPFSPHGLCDSPACRIHAANQVARTLGLYADVVTIPDSFSYALADTTKPTPSQLRWLATLIRVLRELAPMMRAGVIRFWSGRMPLCATHHNEFVNKVDAGVSTLLRDLTPELDATMAGDFIHINGGRLHDPPLHLVRKLTQKDKQRLKAGTSLKELARKIYVEDVKRSVHAALTDLRYSEKISSSLFSTSRQELLALRKFDSDAPGLSDIAAWEKACSMQLPWISKMSVQQVLTLRQEASRALPAFRETFVRQITRTDGNVEPVASAIEQLRAEAAELEAELKALNPQSEATFRNVAGALGITVSVYGFAAGFAPTAVALGGLMSLLGLLHSSARKDEQDEAKLLSKPAYVLVKAKELVEHAPH